MMPPPADRQDETCREYVGVDGFCGLPAERIVLGAPVCPVHAVMRDKYRPGGEV